VPAGNVSITSLTLPPGVEGRPTNPSVSATFTDTAGPAATALTATVDYGDGTPLSTATVTRVGATTSYTVSDTHTYPDESGGLGFNATLHVFENATPTTNTDTLSQRVVAADAPLGAGTLPAGLTHQEFSGVGGTNTAGGALNALNAFEATIGGVKNTAAAPQTGGFRVITWDGVAVDGTDFGGNTTVIVPNKVVGIPINRFQTQGSLFETVYAVSADGFKSVNPNVAAASPALFPSFSPTKTFAMFNDNGIDFGFVLPSGANTAPVQAASRGFGAIFENVRLPNTTSIEYFDGENSLGKFFVPVGAQGQNEFLGELFSSPVVTKVSIVLGTDVLFSFNGTTFSAGGVDNPTTGHNLAVTDDFVYAEPVAVPAPPHLAASAAVPFSGPVATFTDANAGASSKDFTGSITWGDGSTSPANFTALGGGKFAVNGSHTFLKAGSFPVSALVQDFGGSDVTLTTTADVATTATTTILTASTGAAQPGQPVTFTATVTPAAGSAAPTGSVDFLDNGSILATVPLPTTGTGNARTAVLTTPLGPGHHVVTAVYGGDGGFAGSTATAVTVDVPVPPPPPPPPPPPVAPTGLIGVGADAGGAALVSVFNPDGSVRGTATAFANFTGGVRVAVADVNGDGVPDTIVGTGPGAPTLVRVLDGKTGAELAILHPFEASFTGGVFVAAADLTGDGKAEVVVTPDEGGGPIVAVYNGAGLAAGQGDASQLTRFFGIDDPNFRGGARPALGDVNGDGTPDLLVAAGFGGGPRLAGFDGRSLAAGAVVKLFPDFFVFEQTLRNGVFVTAGDLNGDGFADVVAGGGPGGAPRVFALSGKDLLAGTQTVVANFFAGDPNSRGGVRLAVKDLDGDNRADLVAGVGPGAGSHVTAYAGKAITANGTPPELLSFDAFPGFAGGVFVG
jgi:hypothetical protein